jgi:hypothetical protein
MGGGNDGDERRRLRASHDRIPERESETQCVSSIEPMARRRSHDQFRVDDRSLARRVSDSQASLQYSSR